MGYAMTAMQLEPRPLYGIGTVARLTGLKPDTLRVWERRYGLGASHKSRTGRRQYTQSDLEHLQIISKLVRDGVRIGEIASVERKTLEVMLQSKSRRSDHSTRQDRPKVLFIGPALCEWLDEHQGCLANVSAMLARRELSALVYAEELEFGDLDTLVIEAQALNANSVQDIKALLRRVEARRVLVAYQFANQRWMEELMRSGIALMKFPPDAAYVAYEISRTVSAKVAAAGEMNVGDLVTAKPRLFNEKQLSEARLIESGIACECPKHLTDLVRSLASFEHYATECAVENWRDAAVHSCMFVYASQARWLIEKALQAVVDDHLSGRHEEGTAAVCAVLPAAKV